MGSDSGGELGDQYRQEIFAERGSAVYAVLGGDMHIRNGHPVYRFEIFELQARSVDPQRARQQPSRLLAAESRVVPFAGREPELERLAAWRDAPASGLSVFLVHGPAGQGKTRLAVQFAIESDSRGWTVWAGHHVSDPTAQLVVAPGNPGSLLVVVVEYAERWPADDLQLLLQNPILRRAGRTRVLLVSRSAQDWWPALRHRLGKAEVAVGGVIGLTSLAETTEERRAVFDAARDRFAMVFGVSATGAWPPAGLTGRGFDLVLTLHMAALVAVDAQTRGRSAPADPVGLSAYLLDREYDYWQGLYDHQENITTPPQIMARTAYTATLVRPQPLPQAAAALRQAELTSDPVRAIGDHARCYPPTVVGMALEPLYPDRLGEDFIALRTPGHHVADYVPDGWAALALSRLLRRSEQLPFSWTRSAMIVAIETAVRWPHFAQNELYPLLRRQPGLAVEAGGAALTRLTEIDDIPVDVLSLVEEQFTDDGRSVDLDSGIAAIARRLIEPRLAQTDDDRTRGRLLAQLGLRLLRAGLNQDALVALAASADIRRVVTRSGGREDRLHLATTLTNLSTALYEIGDVAGAVAAAREAVEVRHALVADDPGDVEAALDLSGSLNNLGRALGTLNRLEEAIAVFEQAAEILRSLPSGHYQWEEQFATVHHNLGMFARASGDLSRALDAAQATVTARRALAARNPDRYQPDLASTLNNLGSILADVGQSEQALAATEESVRLYGILAQANPAAFERRLAAALNNFSVDLADNGHEAAALAAAQDSLHIRRRLATAEPDAFASDLASSLNNVAVRLIRADRPAEALAAAAESVEVCERGPVVDRGDLVISLITLSTALTHLSQHKNSNATARRAVDLARSLAADRPAAHLATLSRALDNLVVALAAGGERRAARAVSAEAAKIHKRLTGPPQ